MNLQETHPELKGNWWDPQRPTVKWHGTLKLVAGKPATLYLIRYGESKLGTEFRRPFESCGMIHGITGEGRAVTLTQCSTGACTRSSGSEEVEVNAYQVVFGAHLSAQELSFDEVLVEFDYLNDWMTYSRYEEKEAKTEKTSTGSDEREIRIRLNPLYEFPFTAPGYSSSHFFLGFTTNSSAFKFSIESRGNMQIAYEKKRSLREILDDLLPWCWFLTLAIRRQVSFLRLSVGREEIRFQLGAKSFVQPLDVWVPVYSMRKKERTLHSSEMNFTFPDIQENISSVITRWKEMQKTWAATLHRYFATLHREGLRLPEEFLFRAQALEGLQHTGSPQRQRLTQREAYGEAWDRAPASLRALLGKKEAFVDAVRVNRNYLTHYSPHDEEKAYDLSRLYDLSQKLGFLLEALILIELGLPKNIIENAFSRRHWGRLVTWDASE